MARLITDLAEYTCALVQRELVAAPLRYADDLPPGALPAKDRAALRALVTQLDEEISRYEHDWVQCR